MHHFVTEMCTHVHISVTKWCIVGCTTGALWDLCNRPITLLSLLDVCDGTLLAISALAGAVFHIQILAYLVHNISRSQFYIEIWPFV